MGWQPLPDDDHNQMVAAWLEVLEVSGVPVEHYDACYRAARQHQIEAKARGESVMALAAEDLAVEWLKIRDMHAELDRSHLLAENAAGCCPKCYGTGMERMPDGSVRPGCQHEPADESAQPVRDPEAVKEVANLMREALTKIGSPVPNVTENPPKLGSLSCSSCGRKVGKLYAVAGQVCKELLNRGVHDGELKFCDGTLV